MSLPDIQAAPDNRGLWVEEAGVTGLRYPITVYDGESTPQHTVATVTMAVPVEPAMRGAHMSRFIEVLHAHAARIGQTTMRRLATDLRQHLGVAAAVVELRFPYFVDRPSPVTGKHALLECEAWLRHDGALSIGVQVPITTLCPCSKAISDYGAHNQRGYLTLEIQPKEQPPTPLALDEIVDIGTSCASAPIYPLLKRPDERVVTMRAYEHPMFVEDVVRAVSVILRDDPRVLAFMAEARNLESIHVHDAYARVRSPCWSERIADGCFARNDVSLVAPPSQIDVALRQAGESGDLG
jgi:GTP cyclohydrolase FolE2